MLALRDQENLVHSHQTAAAAKPLNQGVRQLQPKTPGTRAPKTPFKVPLNDENGPLAFGKKTVKGKAVLGIQNENTIRSGKDGFVTPVDARNRAPLGMKTTNAKAKNFQTPAPSDGTLKPFKTNRRSSTAQKVKKANVITQQIQADTSSNAGEEDDVPDIEYMPPKPNELPDDPDYITYDTTFPQFKGRNMIRGWEKVYLHGPIGKDGLTNRERKFKEDSIAYDRLVDQMIQKQVDEMPLAGINFREDPDDPCWEEIKKQREEEQQGKSDPVKVAKPRAVSTIKSRDAATALSKSGKSTIPSMNRSKSVDLTAKKGTSLLTSKKATVLPPTNPSGMRHAAAMASSRTTLGYSKGRVISSVVPSKTPQSSVRKEPSNSILSPEKYLELYGTPPMGSEMWDRCEAAGLLENIPQTVMPVYEEDEETRNFELTL